MNFGGSRLGFWWRWPPGLPDRRLSTNRVLVFYDPYTNVSGNTDYYNTGGDVNPLTGIWPVIQAREIALGFQPELIVGYNNLPTNLIQQYAHLWDIGYASPYTTNPTFNPTTLLSTYIQEGGAMFMLGENAYFQVRDTTIETFVASLGGGNALSNTPGVPTVVTQTVEPEFRVANQSSTITWGAPAGFDSYGTATPITTGGGISPTAVMWKTGSLSNAPKGAIVSVLDINFFGAEPFPQYYDPDFIDNLSITMNKL